jgi:uncharacterized protein
VTANPDAAYEHEFKTVECRETKPRVGRQLRRLSSALVVIVVSWLGVSWVVAHQLTRRPRSPFPEPAPAVAWGKLESHRLTTRDGLEIGAWSIKGNPGKPSVLVLHGNGGSRRNSLKRAELLASQGFGVLLISHRAHGDSTGDFNDIGFGARLDVVAAVEFLERARPGECIVVLGTSLGSAAAIFASKELAHRVHGYILESPYQSLKVAVRNRVQNALVLPVLYHVVYGGLLVVAPLVLPHVDQISPVNSITDIPTDTPILILAGGLDHKARPDEARLLHERVRDHSRLILFERAGHGKFLDEVPQLYRQTILGFLSDLDSR